MVDLKEVRRAANRLLSLFRAAERDLFKIEAADRTALVEAIVDDAMLVGLGVDVVGETLNKLLKGLLNGSLVLVFDELINGTENEFTTGRDEFVVDEDELPEMRDEKRLIRLLSSTGLFAGPVALLLLSSLTVLVNKKSSIVLFSLVNSLEFASPEDVSSDDEAIGDSVVVVVVDVVEDGSRLLRVSSLIMFVGKSFLVKPDDDESSGCLNVLDVLIGFNVVVVNLPPPDLELFGLVVVELLLLLLLNRFTGLLMNSSIEVMFFEFKNLFGIVVLFTIELSRSLLLGPFKLSLFEVRFAGG